MLGARAPSEARRVIGYVRVSTRGQQEHGTSLDGQRADILRFCAAAGLPKPRIEVEVEGAGEEKQERRVVLNAILAALREGDRVVVWKLDRFSRSTLFTLDAIERFKKAGAKLLSVTENIDPDTHDGYLFLTILAGFAKREKERILERTIGRRRALRAGGAMVEGTAPLGYRIRERRLVVVEEEATMVRAIFARSVAGASVREVARWLAGQGRALEASGISYLLRNRAYLGETETEARVKTRGKRREGSGEWVKTHEPIIDRVTFERAARAAEGRKRKGRPLGSGLTAGWLLRGLMVCAYCEHTLTAKGYAPSQARNPSHDGWYACRLRLGPRENEKRCARGVLIRRTLVDAAVEALVVAELEKLREHFGKARVRAPAPVAVDWGKRRADLERRRVRIVEAYSVGDMKRPDLRAALDRLDRLSAALDVAERDAAEVVDVVDTPAARRRALAAVGAIAEAWPGAAVEERRRVLVLLAERIAVASDGRPRVTWRGREALLGLV